MSEISRLDGIIRRLFQSSKLPRDTAVHLKIDDLQWLCDVSIAALGRDPTVLRLEAPVAICGDLHGQFYDLLTFFELGGRPPETRYLFLGDYVDRGHNSIETFSLLLALKIKYPDEVWLIRGNHETAGISEMYGFFEECALRYNQDLWVAFCRVFLYIPLVAVIEDRIFCVHGGLSPELLDIAQLDAIQRPVDIPRHGMLADLVWADPSLLHVDFQPSDRGTSFTYGPDVTDMFLRRHGFELICRAHQVVPAGFDFPFRPHLSVLTIFSAPNYCQTYGNLGAMLKVDDKLKCSFEFVAPHDAAIKPQVRPGTPEAV
jgi:serine/threonine-protein phosphatase PP1 catalytic subunit